MARTAWTADFENKSEQRQLDTILTICRLETINSVTKDDLRYLLRWLADKMIEEDVADG